MRLRTVALTLLATLAAGAEPATIPFPPVPAQDQGLPYTRTGMSQARARLATAVAAFAGSRIGYVHGLRVTLDAQEPRRWAAVRRDGVVLVPAAFAALATGQPPRALDQPLPYLADRWVSQVERPALPADVPTVAIDGHPYVDLAALARARGLPVTVDPSGLVVIGPADLPQPATPAFEALVTCFDSPERFADPSIAPRWIPSLIRQGTWDQHVRPTPAQVALLEGPETVWTMTPPSADDLTGFDARWLGSPVPAPGIYPRLLFSPQDVPALRERLLATASGQAGLIEQEELFRKTWWDPSTDDGRVFALLSQGRTDGLEFQEPKAARSWEPQTPAWNPQHLFVGQKPGIFNSHVWYVPQCLTTMAFWALITGNEERGRQAATALATYYALREPFIDQQYAVSDTEFGGNAGSTGDGATHWRRSFHPAQHMDLAFALDFGGAFMTDAQKAVLQRIIAKLTYGRRSHAQDGPVRLRDINWMTWDLNHVLATTAIEGLPGYDPEVYDVGRESTAAFLEWGISPSGTMYETNGKSPAGLHFQVLTMLVQARRGDNRFGHPHLRRLLTAQVQMTSPTGRVIMNSGTQYVPHSREILAWYQVETLKALYPQDRAADLLLQQAELQQRGDPGSGPAELKNFDPAAHRARVAADKRRRLPGPTYPSLARTVLFSADWAPVTRADLGLPLDFVDPVQGVLSSRSDQTTTATWISTLVLPNRLLGAGHHHSNSGSFHVSALGVDWITQSPFSQTYDGAYHNQVLVDGVSMPGQWSSRAAWLGAATGNGGAAASADLTYAYSWRWLTQPPFTWNDDLKSLAWEVEPAEDILRVFRGTQAMKFRPWWPTYVSSTWMPTCRAPFNPVRLATRSVALVRGAQPYAVVVDDVVKDDQPRTYTWTAALNGGVVPATLPGLAPSQVALAFRPDAKPGAAAVVPAAGEPVLVVTVFDGTAPVPVQVATRQGPPDRQGKTAPWDRLEAEVRAPAVAFRTVLTPVRAGAALPAVTPAGVTWDGQQDSFTWTRTDAGRTRLTVQRGNDPVVATP